LAIHQYRVIQKKITSWGIEMQKFGGSLLLTVATIFGITGCSDTNPFQDMNGIVEMFRSASIDCNSTKDFDAEKSEKEISRYFCFVPGNAGSGIGTYYISTEGDTIFAWGDVEINVSLIEIIGLDGDPSKKFPDNSISKTFKLYSNFGFDGKAFLRCLKAGKNEVESSHGVANCESKKFRVGYDLARVIFRPKS